MADYINTNWVTDRHCKDLVARQAEADITEMLTIVDGQIDGMCQMKGVPVDSIPVDEDSYITSTKLIEFARFSLYVELLSAYWGSAHGLNDIYYEKLQFYTGELARAESELTKDNILQNEPLSSSSSIQQVVIY